MYVDRYLHNFIKISKYQCHENVALQSKSSIDLLDLITPNYTEYNLPYTFKIEC